MKNIFLLIITLIAVQYSHAGLPPTSSKGDLESGFSTTFQTDYDKIPLTRTGTNIKLGTIPVAQGGTGSTTQNFVDLTTNQTIAGDKNFTAPVITDDVEFNDPAYSTITLKRALGHQVSTGVVDGAILSINADPTKFDISQQVLSFSDATLSADLPAIKFVTCPALVAQTVTFLAVADTSYLLVGDDCVITQQTTFPTQIERRTKAFLGRLAHINHVNLSTAATLPDFVVDTNSQLYDLFDAIGAFNISGNVISANGANLSFNKSGGITFRRSVGYPTNKKNPNTIAIAGATPANFFKLTRGSLDPVAVAVIDPGFYNDTLNNITAIPGPNARSTNRRVFLFSNGQIAVQYGQQYYSSLAEAVAGVSTETYETNPTATDGGILLGIISCRKDATLLNDETNCHITKAGRFDNSGITVGSLATTTMQQAYLNSVTPQITTSTTQGSVDIKRGSAADTDNVFRIQNGAGTPTATVTGAGVITGSNLTGTNTGDLISKGQSEGSTATTTQVQAPLEQLTNLATGVELIETGNDNVLPNPGIEAATINWAGYDDAASTPVDGTSGTVTTTCTDSSSSPLDGTKSLLITKAAANHQGEGCSVPFTIGSSGKYKMHTVRFDYEATHANYADDYIKVYAISSAGAVIEVLAGDNGVKANGNGGTFLGSFQATDATSYRIALHVFDSSSNAWTFKADNIEVSRKQPSVKGAVVTDWAAYTPTFAGMSTQPTNIEIFYKRIGDTVSIYGRFNIGTTTAADLSFTLPAGMTIATTTSTANVRGKWWRNNPTASTRRTGNLITTSATNLIKFGNDDYTTASSPFTALLGNVVESVGGLMEVEIHGIPVAGLSSNLTLSEDGGQRKIEFSVRKSGNQTGVNPNATEVKVTWDTVEKDTTNSFSTANSRFIAPETRRYSFLAQAYVNGANVLNNNYGIAWYKNGAIYKYGAVTTAEASTQFSANSEIEIDLLKDEYVEVYLYGLGNNSASTLTLVGSASVSYFQGHAIQSPQTLAGSENAVIARGATGSPDIQSVYFGLGATCVNQCTSGSCGICTRVGSKITSVTWDSIGNYRVNGIDGTKYNCQGNAIGTDFAYGMHNRVSSNSTSAYMSYSNSAGANHNIGYAVVTCIGIP